LNNLFSGDILKFALGCFGVEKAEIEVFGSGLINGTWKVSTGSTKYILQKVNHRVFSRPTDIGSNIRMIAHFLRENNPAYYFISHVLSKRGEDVVYLGQEGWFRLIPFVDNSFSYDVVDTAEQAYEAARQFGNFTKSLSKFDVRNLKITIPNFHNLYLRYQQFLESLASGNKGRIHESRPIIEVLLSYKNIVYEFQSIVLRKDFKLRVTHHDTKISNVLFDATGKGLCVVDLDTVMPGYFISDVGDMMRTYISPVSEEEKDLEKVGVRHDFYKAIVDGYSDEMADELTELEKKYFKFAGKFMVYMQALRFMTDHINDDVYYGSRYEGHNLMRAKNQVMLLQQLQD
jgi:Ser/Thr protein kinase RdoA (MazF antagonist)